MYGINRKSHPFKCVRTQQGYRIIGAKDYNSHRFSPNCPYPSLANRTLYTASACENKSHFPHRFNFQPLKQRRGQKTISRVRIHHWINKLELRP